MQKLSFVIQLLYSQQRKEDIFESIWWFSIFYFPKGTYSLLLRSLSLALSNTILAWPFNPNAGKEYLYWYQDYRPAF